MDSVAYLSFPAIRQFFVKGAQTQPSRNGSVYVRSGYNNEVEPSQLPKVGGNAFGKLRKCVLHAASTNYVLL